MSSWGSRLALGDAAAGEGVLGARLSFGFKVYEIGT